ncbi:SurA N-terminal domain-containing protein [Marinobacter sp. X15-166B]|uniref:SurA N-terminal domain-containing protein n=1 Tax=Marinobacter sp. X15-166B TaxID=1897620 RepID=UPI00085CA99C|nr:SurA N-terminal domain-containing protein [Marinobacter sp. X15-166B]OEY67171.1 peptidylprolyl isomerase [Marinobacter sp. X15-166B]
MLQDIRDNAQGTIAKIIIGLLIVSLSIWGMDAIIGGFSGEPEVATVNGEDITEREFLRVVQLERQRQLAQMEQQDAGLLNDDQIRQEVLEALIQEQTLIQDASEQGLELSDAEIDALITQIPQFQVNGAFNRDQFVAYVRNLGMGVGEFREVMRKQYVVNQIRTGILQSGLATAAGAERLLALQNQTRSFRTLTVAADTVADEVEVTAEEVASYYQENPELFALPDRVDAEYLVLSLAALADPEAISDQDLEAYYRSRAADLAAEERHSAHILIADGKDAARRLQEVQDKLAAGESFEALAAEYSDDKVSGRQGGDLGFAGRNVFDAPYEDALFALQVGEISEPVTTAFGTHLIKLLEVRESPVPPLADLEEQLRTELAQQRASEAYAQARTRLADLAYAAADLQEPAEALQLEIREQANVTREAVRKPFDHPGLVRQLFSDDVLNGGYNTELVDVGNNVSVVARVVKHHPATTQALEEVADDIRHALTQSRVRERLQARADSLLAALENGDTVAAEEADWQRYEEQSRMASGVDGRVLQTAFSLPRPPAGEASYGTAHTDDAVVLVALEAVTDGKVDENSGELKQLQRFIASLQGQREYAAYQQALREQATIKRP